MPLYGCRRCTCFVLSFSGKSFSFQFKFRSSKTVLWFIAKKFVTVEPVSPEVLIYENNPLQGILYNRDVGSQYKLSNQEITFRAAPYYFSTKDIFSFTFDWLINGAKVSAPEKDEMTLRVEDDSAGSSRISIQVKNPKKIFQNSKKEFLINYGNN